jgi:hypothetical protein
MVHDVVQAVIEESLAGQDRADRDRAGPEVGNVVDPAVEAVSAGAVVVDPMEEAVAVLVVDEEAEVALRC